MASTTEEYQQKAERAVTNMSDPDEQHREVIGIEAQTWASLAVSQALRDAVVQLNNIDKALRGDPSRRTS